MLVILFWETRNVYSEENKNLLCNAPQYLPYILKHKRALTWAEVCVEFHDVVYRNGGICEMCTIPEVWHTSQHRSSDITVRWSDFTLINQFLIVISSTRLMLLVISLYLGGWTEGWACIPPFLWTTSWNSTQTSTQVSTHLWFEFHFS